MDGTKNKMRILLTSLLLTFIIFGTGMALNYSFDFLRINSIVRMMNEHEIDSDAYIVHTEFISEFGGDECEAMRSRIEDLKKEMKTVGDELSTYGRLSFFKKKDFDYLKRKYSLLELRFFMIIRKLNDQCEQPYIPILFFYKIDHDFSERQGFILSDVNLQYPQEIIILSFDKDYVDEHLVKLLVERFNVTSAPTIIINDDLKLEGLHYQEEIKSILNEIILDRRLDQKDYDASYVLNAVGDDVGYFSEKMKSLLRQDISDFAKGDIYFALGRVNKDKEMLCKSLDYYSQYQPQTMEEEAILYETMASVGCGVDRKELLVKASKLWKKIGVEFRAKIDKELADSNKPSIVFETSGPYFSPVNHSTGEIIIGKSSITLDENDILVSQTDRVTRDWLSYQIFSSPYSENLLTVFSEGLTYTEKELQRDIGWHEGARIKELKQIGLTHTVASGTIVAKKGKKWYAPDENGTFRFEVPKDKILYPTTRFLTDEIAVLIDTHGINSIVEQAVRKNASVVVGCCDHIGKIKAAKYLAEKGISVVCFTDKYLPILLGSKLPILGSPPVKIFGDRAVLGNSPITISVSETIVAEDLAENSTAQSYYDTPARYFKNLEMMQKLNVVYAHINRTGEMQTVIDAADSVGASVVGVRVHNIEDYEGLRMWLLNNHNNRAVLFHSTSYPYGYKIFSEFPEQTSFDDINPIFK